MRTVFFISKLDLMSGNSAGSARVDNLMTSLSLCTDVKVEHCRFSGRLLSYFADLSRKVANADESSIYFYPSQNPFFEILFLIWAKLFYSGHIFCDINEVRRYECTYIRRFNAVKRALVRVISIFQEKLSSQYDGLVCISKLIREYFSKYNDNSIIIPILSDIPEITPCHKIEGPVFRFAFVGSVCVEKENLAELFEGFGLLNNKKNNWRFDIYGAPPFNDYSDVDSYIDKFHLRGKVFLNGIVKHCDVADILSSSDCLILPRRDTMQNHYGFSTKLSEYAVSGTPILMTDTGVVSQYFHDGENCLMVEGYSSDGFCEKMELIMDMTDGQRQAISNAAFAVAKDNFDLKMYSNELLNFLR